ncbi:ImpA family type VI secretion system protein [Serratia sp. L9]|uniref:type VI secretion system protein TssA n=1 Tax=Serratia sp. L9 TaxID=3423946 RepID=UPI003D6729B8
MDDTFSPDLFGVEFDPLYSEIEAILAQLNESADPLSMPNEPARINWRLIAEQSAKLLEQCFDLRVALWLIRANMHLEGMSALFQGLTSLDKQITENQSKIYPISEDEPFNNGHAAALGWLSTAQCIAELKAARVTVEHPYSVQELINTESITGQSSHSQGVASTQILQVNTYFQQNGLPDLIEQFTALERAVKRIEDYANQYSESYQLDCDLLHVFITKCITFITQSNNHEKNMSISLSETAISSGLSSTATLHAEDISIRSRQEIILMLDRILEYFQHFEPSHPAPIFIRRTKQMIGMDFISIVEDLLPESLNTLQQFTGK